MTRGIPFLWIFGILVLCSPQGKSEQGEAFSPFVGGPDAYNQKLDQEIRRLRTEARTNPLWQLSDGSLTDVAPNPGDARWFVDMDGNRTQVGGPDLIPTQMRRAQQLEQYHIPYTNQGLLEKRDIILFGLNVGARLNGNAELKETTFLANPYWKQLEWKGATPSGIRVVQEFVWRMLGFGGKQEPMAPKDIFVMACKSLVVITTESGLGSGVVIDASGRIATSQHVVADAKRVRCRLIDGKSLSNPRLYSSDEATDTVGIQVDEEGLSAVVFADPSTVHVGDKAFALGHPKGEVATFSDGIISGIRKKDDVVFFQFTCPISPGNSGGPLLNERGELLGIVAGFLKDAQNANFAVNAWVLRRLLQ
jgi:hypothetical protein